MSEFQAQDSTRVPASCTASYYARAFEGRRCSSGEIFRHAAMTAAHKTLRFGTFVKVTNTSNDSMIVVKINDRMPARSRRCIDLTRAGAMRLNFIRQGLADVRLEVVDTLISETR